MSYKKQYFEWNVTKDELIPNTPVGYEVEFSQDPRFYPILYRLSTYDEVVSDYVQGKFYYSLNNGITWVDFPLGDSGQIFNQPYKMRLVVSVAEVGYIYALRSNKIYRITGNGKSIIDYYEINEPLDFSRIEIQEKDDILFLYGVNNTLYKLQINQTIEPFTYSLNLNSNPLTIAVDSSRRSFWEINENNICLKTFNGEKIFCLNNPLKPIDVECSSSSSESSSSSSIDSSSSSSSKDYSSSSSSIDSSSSSSIDSSSSSSSLNYSSESSSIDSSSSSSGYEGIGFDRVEIDFGVG